MEIELYIPETTVERENSRNVEGMALEDLLYWTFSVRVDFLDGSGNRVFSLPEAALFQVLDGLSKARREALDKSGATVSINDREGAFRLTIETVDGLTTVFEEFTKASCEVNAEEFVQATDEFSDSAISEAERLFPKLIHNPNYQQLISDLSSQRNSSTEISRES